MAITVIIFGISSLLLIVNVSGDDPEAKDKCRSLHHTDVDIGDYLSYKCKLICNIHNQLWNHSMSEGEVCPGLAGTNTSNRVCKEGECVTLAKLGYIDIEIASAEVPHKSNAYGEVCLQNDSSTVTLPLRDRTSCGQCQTNVIEGSAHPVWQKICTGSSQKKWLDSARVTFQFWDKIDASITNFIGGATITIQQLISDGNSHKEIKVALTGGAQAASAFVRITWTPA